MSWPTSQRDIFLEILTVKFGIDFFKPSNGTRNKNGANPKKPDGRI